MNIPSNQIAATRGTISDAAITLASVDPCYSCTERCVVIDKGLNKKILTGEDLIKLSQEKTQKIKEELLQKREKRQDNYWKGYRNK